MRPLLSSAVVAAAAGATSTTTARRTIPRSLLLRRRRLLASNASSASSPPAPGPPTTRSGGHVAPTPTPPPCQPPIPQHVVAGGGCGGGVSTAGGASTRTKLLRCANVVVAYVSVACTYLFHVRTLAAYHSRRDWFCYNVPPIHMHACTHAYRAMGVTSAIVGASGAYIWVHPEAIGMDPETNGWVGGGASLGVFGMETIPMYVNPHPFSLQMGAQPGRAPRAAARQDGGADNRRIQVARFPTMGRRGARGQEDVQGGGGGPGGGGDW